VENLFDNALKAIGINTVPLIDRQRMIRGLELNKRSKANRSLVNVSLQMHGVRVAWHPTTKPTEVRSDPHSLVALPKC